MRLAYSFILLSACAVLAGPVALAQSTDNGPIFISRDGDQTPPPRTPPVVHVDRTPPFSRGETPPVTYTPPRLPPQVVTPPMFTQPQPIDLTNNFNNIPHDVDLPFLPRTSEGIQLSNNFPDEKRFKGKSEWILVRGDEESVFTRPTEYSAVLEKGTILVSVRRPSETGLVKTPIGDVALHSDGDVMLTWTGGVLRICNLSALGSNCKAKFDNKIFGDGKSQTVVLKPGFEAVASVDHKLGRADLRPSDGIARRRANLLADGHLGVSEFSLQSLLQTSAVIAHLQAANNAKDTRVLAQMSKMAAVLNAVNSPYGYTQEGQTGVASNPQAH